MGLEKVRILKPWQAKWMMTLYPPLLISRCRPLIVSDDFRHVRVKVARSFLNTNINGTTFGGSIFAAADPWYALMFWQIFAKKKKPVQVWVKSASIDYIKPADSHLYMDFIVTDEMLVEAENALANEPKITRNYPVEAKNKAGEIIAVITTEVYMRNL